MIKEWILSKFDVEKTVSYWHEGAEYDIGVAEAMYEKRNTHMHYLWGILP